MQKHWQTTKRIIPAIILSMALCVALPDTSFAALTATQKTALKNAIAQDRANIAESRATVIMWKEKYLANKRDKNVGPSYLGRLNASKQMLTVNKDVLQKHIAMLRAGIPLPAPTAYPVLPNSLNPYDQGSTPLYLLEGTGEGATGESTD